MNAPLFYLIEERFYIISLKKGPDLGEFPHQVLLESNFYVHMILQVNILSQFLPIYTYLLQGVLALCEFHYCEFHYCGFSKLLLKFG